jgi:hypothetical protein
LGFGKVKSCVAVSGKIGFLSRSNLAIDWGSSEIFISSSSAGYSVEGAVMVVKLF